MSYSSFISSSWKHPLCIFFIPNYSCHSVKHHFFHHQDTFVVRSKDKCVLLKDHNAVTPVRLEPAGPLSRVKYSTTGPLRSNHKAWYACKVYRLLNQLGPYYLFFQLLQSFDKQCWFWWGNSVTLYLLHFLSKFSYKAFNFLFYTCF